MKEKEIIIKNKKEPLINNHKIDKILSDLDNRLLRLEQKIDYLLSSFVPELK